MKKRGLIWEANTGKQSTKRVCLLLGSLKSDIKKSNSYTLASTLIPHFEEAGYTVDEIVLADKFIAPGITLKVDHPDDEFKDIFDSMNESEIIVFATPIWWNSASSLIQQVIERLDSVDEMHLAGKKHPFLGKSFGVVVSGGGDGSQTLIERLNAWASFLAMTCPPFNSVSHLGDPKEVVDTDDFKSATKATAENLIKAAELDVEWSDWM